MLYFIDDGLESFMLHYRVVLLKISWPTEMQMKKILDFDKKSAALQKRLVKEAVAEATKVVLGKSLTAETYSINEASKILGQSPQTLNRWRKRGIGPKATIGQGTNSIFYSKQSLTDYIQNKPENYSEIKDKTLQQEIEEFVEAKLTKIYK
jgi:transposase